MRPIVHPTQYAPTTPSTDDIAAAAVGPIQRPFPNSFLRNPYLTGRRSYLILIWGFLERLTEHLALD